MRQKALGQQIHSSERIYQMKAWRKNAGRRRETGLLFRFWTTSGSIFVGIVSPNRDGSELGRRDALLTLILSAAVFVGNFADFIGFEKQNLGYSFVGVNLGGHWRGVGKFQRYVSFPLGFKGRHVNNDSTPGVRAFSQTDRHDVPRDAKVFHRPSQRKAVRWDDDVIGLDIDEALGVKLFRIDDRAVYVGKELELISTPHVVAIAGSAIRNDPPAVNLFNLMRLERINHAGRFHHASDPIV